MSGPVSPLVPQASASSDVAVTGPGTGGGLRGTSGGGAGRTAFLRGWLINAVFLTAAWVVNSMTIRADMPEVAAWKPWAWEGTSVLILIVLAWLPGFAAVYGQRHPPLWRLVVAHLICLVALSAVHVPGMFALRHGLYAALGETYHRAPLSERLLYEFRKDVFTYAIATVVFSLMLRRPTVIRTEAPASLQATYDIQEGARLIRTPVADILAASSAGNYVEFHLADGRKPLMRTTLTAVEKALAGAGFVRTHRAWLINPSRMTGLEPSGSGDWTVILSNFTAPLSRRYRDRIKELKAR